MMETSNKKSTIDQFCSVTGAGHDVAVQMLEACSGNLELAIEMHMEAGSSSPSQQDGVRAPIPQTQEVLVEDAAYASNFRGRKRKNKSVFDGFRDFQEEARQQEEQLRSGASGSKASRKTKTLQDLFRPPVDLTYKGTFANARDSGKNSGKWLMINIQNVQEFACQALNRDVWSNPTVKAIIKEHFIFWQVYHDSEEGEKYKQFYKVENWPYVAVVDPQTGENIIVWNKIEPLTFCDLVTEFLSQRTPIETVSPPAKRVRREDSIVDAHEDEQLKAAIQASLTQVTKPTTITDTDSETYSDLETFTDSDDAQDTPQSPIKTRRSSASTSSCRNLRGNSGSPTLPSSERRNTRSSCSPHKNDKGSSPKRKSDRCESPLVSNEKQTERCRRNSSPCAQNSSPKGKSNLRNTPSKKSNSVAQSKVVKDGVSSNNIAGTSCVRKVTGEGAKGDKHETKVDKCDTSSASDSDITDTSKHDDSAIADTRDYKQYLGKDTGNDVTIMLRLPDGQREKLCIPSSSQLMAIVLFVGSKGFSNERYELVAHFPHRQLSQLDFDATLTDIGLHPQETIFVQARS